MEKINSKFLLFLLAVLLIFFAVSVLISVKASCAQADEIAAPSQPTVESVTHSTGLSVVESVTYYASITLTLSGAGESEYYEYKLGEGTSWIQITGSELLIDFTVSAPLYLRITSNTAGSSSELSYGTMNVDVGPSVSFVEPEPSFYTPSGYDVSFSYGACFVPFTTTVTLLPYGIPSGIATGATKFLASENGTYRLTTTSATGAIGWSDFVVDRIDNEQPVFDVIAQRGGNNGEWAASTSYVIIPYALPVSGVEYQYSFDNGNWTTSLDDYDTKYVITPTLINNHNGTISFRAISGSGLIYNFSPDPEDANKFKTCVDSIVPHLSLTPKETPEPGKVTNVHIVLTVNLDAGLSGATLYFGIEGEPPIPHSAETITIYQPGLYSFYAVSGAGLSTETLTYNANYLDVEKPTIQGATDGSFYNGDVTLSISDAAGIARLSVVRNGKDEAASLDDMNIIRFTKNGTYYITVEDSAGNIAVMFFEIDRPNIGLIVSLTLLSVAVAAAFIWLVLSNMKKAASIRRLVGNSTTTDADNKFLMFKRIRKDKGGNKNETT
ncbi:MAG: hypothetical protein LBE09_01105 [Christensenellaceae bacterium]|jgi:hypothetical protein|nr:hypothetical protein [Christensenellaceae bacterium]